LIVVLIAIATIGAEVLGIEGLPSIRMTMGVAVLVSIAAFVVANVSTPSAARLACVTSIAVIAVVASLRAYELAITRKVTAATLVDVVLALGVMSLLVPLCRSAWHDMHEALPT